MTFDIIDIVEVLVKFEATTCGVENPGDFVTVPEEECVILLVLFEILLVGDIDAALEIDIVVGEEYMLVDFIVEEKMVAIVDNLLLYGNILLALTKVEEEGVKVIEGVDFFVIGIIVALLISVVVIVIGANILVLVEELGVVGFIVGVVAKLVVVVVLLDVVIGEILLILLVKADVVVGVLPIIIDSVVSSDVVGTIVIVLVVLLDDTASVLIVEIKVGTSKIVAFVGLVVIGMVVACLVDRM